MRIGVLTGGGDCPGTNAVIRAITRKGTVRPGDSVMGFYDSWDGVMEQRAVELTTDVVRGTISRGGTILGTRRGSPLDDPRGIERVRHAVEMHRLDGLIVIGGNGSLTVAALLHEQMGLPVVGVPLPFISYGGTAMVTLGLALGILMSIAKSKQLVQT
jgi:6-phosphofructokinase 1